MKLFPLFLSLVCAHIKISIEILEFSFCINNISDYNICIHRIYLIQQHQFLWRGK